MPTLLGSRALLQVGKFDLRPRRPALAVVREPINVVRFVK